ncbi:hypothetical protein B7463_g7296, partial [Scytalidium lignicola]
MPAIYLRQEFPSLKAFKEALHAWAIEAHFEPRILKSDTGRVRVGCKRDPNCPFVIRCNWERKPNRDPLARVTVLKEQHTCLNGNVDDLMRVQANASSAMDNGGLGVGMAGQGGAHGARGMSLADQDGGVIVGGARVIGPVGGTGSHVVPVLPKVQRNSASRLPFLMEILPRLMNITKDTTPMDIRECLLREFGQEVHLQQCRRAKTEILKKTNERTGNSETHDHQPSEMQIPNMGSAPSDPFRNMSPQQPPQPQPFALHAAAGIVAPPVPDRSSAALQAVSEPPVRCPYCVNHRWFRSIKDAVEHMSVHVVV